MCADSAEELVESSPNGVDDRRRSLRDLVVRELIGPESVSDECVQPLGVPVELILRAMEAIAEQLDNHRRAREATIDTNETAACLRQHLLRARSGQSGVGEQDEEASLQPAVPTSNLMAFDRGQQPVHPVTPGRAERDDAAVDKLLAVLAVAQT
jgi:hypothetical protein